MLSVDPVAAARVDRDTAPAAAAPPSRTEDVTMNFRRESMRVSPSVLDARERRWGTALDRRFRGTGAVYGARRKRLRITVACEYPKSRRG
jgi:hypothetical protein